MLACLLASATWTTWAQTTAAMQEAIEAKKFQKIGSVLVEQDGHVTCEHYFDGDATTLRDTRSATKTITSLLTGGGLRLSSMDLLKIAEMMREGGKVDGKQLVSADWVKASTMPRAHIQEGTEYGYFWWAEVV